MTFPWYAIRVRSNYEQTASRYLDAVGYEVFVPTYEDRRRGCDRIRRVQVPLFPGYIMCRMDTNFRMPVLTAPGVVNIVGFGSEFVSVPEDEIQAVRLMIASQVAVEQWPYVNVGERVRIVDGPLAGLTGILADFKNRQRLIISVHLLQRSVAAEVDRDAVRPEGPGGVPFWSRNAGSPVTVRVH